MKFLQVCFSTTSVLIHFVWRLFLLHGSWTQGWGVFVPRVPLGYLRHFLVECHVTAHIAFPWSSSVETNI
jgi:hypothetical protein